LIPAVRLKPDITGELQRAHKGACRKSGNLASAHYLLGQTLMQMGRPDDAQKEMARWQELKGKIEK